MKMRHKSEGRRPKAERNPKAEIRTSLPLRELLRQLLRARVVAEAVGSVRPSGFGFSP
jgi:hypothetical protein